MKNVKGCPAFQMKPEVVPGTSPALVAGSSIGFGCPLSTGAWIQRSASPRYGVSAARASTQLNT